MGWLLDSDPALRWQIERDLLGEPESVWEATRGRIATEGMGQRLLDLQDEDGQWAGGSYFPERNETRSLRSPDDDKGQSYIATTWTLNALREWGLDAKVLGDTGERIRAHSRWDYDDLPYWGGEVDCCINAFTLANGAWLGIDMTELAAWFPQHQLADGGWNCEWVEGSVRSSFHSTLNSLRDILAYERIVGPQPDLTAARHRAHEYLLQRRLLYRLSSGEVVGPWVANIVYPFRWKYTALRALDYFRDASDFDGTPRDERMSDAVEIVRQAEGPDGRWIQGGRYPGEVWFDVDVKAGERSPWLTFFATRALAWWDGQ